VEVADGASEQGEGGGFQVESRKISQLHSSQRDWEVAGFPNYKEDQ
jgi:hypothetical protein